MDLFSSSFETEVKRQAPLAVRMRPRSLDEFRGQDEIIGAGTFLRRMIESDNLPSMIFFGPPGTGKTTLAHIIAGATGSHFDKLNAVTSGVADIRRTIEAAKDRIRLYGKRTILFIDEIHRFNKSQQDALLPYVEDGTVILIGATTENPFFEVNAPLLSRTRIIRLKALNRRDIADVLQSAMADTERGLGTLALKASEEVFLVIADASGGDARIALNLLEQAAALPAEGKFLTIEMVRSVAGDRVQRYDKKGDNHYDVVSAFIKSMRGSDPDAAVHYLARMLSAGEDIKFIARRIVICAAEDVGNADPMALLVANSAAQAAQFLGLPEARIPLAQAVTYIACAPKSNAAYAAIDAALNDISHMDCGSVPPHLRDTHYQGARQLRHGCGYMYPHDYPDGWVNQQYLPDLLLEKTYYHPAKRGEESKFSQYLATIRRQA